MTNDELSKRALSKLTIPDLQDLIYATLIDLYGGQWTVRCVEGRNKLIVHGPNEEYGELIIKEILQNRIPEKFINYIKGQIK